MTIRLAQEGDAEALVALQRGSYEEGAWLVGDGPANVESLRRRNEVASELVFVGCAQLRFRRICSCVPSFTDTTSRVSNPWNLDSQSTLDLRPALRIACLRRVAPFIQRLKDVGSLALLSVRLRA